MSAEYDNYLTDHISNVHNAAEWMIAHGIVDADSVDDLRALVSEHDGSKYATIEYEAYDAYFYGHRERTKQVIDDFNYAWLEHIHKNAHHWQHWVLIEDEGHTIAIEMDKVYVYEMISDWWSFSWNSDNLYEVFNWYAKHEKKMILHENTRKLVEDILDKINAFLDQEEENADQS